MEATDAGLFDPRLGRSPLMGIIGALILGTAMLAGTAATMNYNSNEAEKSRKFQAEREDLAYERNSAEADKAREFQAEQRATAYQTTVDDMEAAGLNPAAMYGSFNGATGAYSTNAATAPSAGAGPAASYGGNALSGIGDMIRTAFLLNKLKQTPGGVSALTEISRGMQMSAMKSGSIGSLL